MKYYYIILILVFNFTHQAFSEACLSNAQVRVYGEHHNTEKAIELAKYLGRTATKTNSIILYEGVPSNFNDNNEQLRDFHYYFTDNNSKIDLHERVFGLEDELIKSVILIGVMKTLVENSFHQKIRTNINDIKHLLGLISNLLINSSVQKHLFGIPFSDSNYNNFIEALTNEAISRNKLYDMFLGYLQLKKNNIMDFVGFLAAVHDRALHMSYQFSDLSQMKPIGNFSGSIAGNYISEFEIIREKTMVKVLKTYACNSSHKNIHVIVGAHHLKGMKAMLAAKPIKNSIKYFDLETLKKLPVGK